MPSDEGREADLELATNPYNPKLRGRAGPAGPRDLRMLSLVNAYDATAGAGDHVNDVRRPAAVSAARPYTEMTAFDAAMEFADGRRTGRS